MRFLLAAYRQAWAIRPVEAVEFYGRTGWTVVLLLLAFLCLTFPAYRQDIPLLYDKLGYAGVVGLLAFCLVIGTIDTPLRLAYPDEYERFMLACCLGDRDWLESCIGYRPMSMRWECRMLTLFTLAIALVLVALVFSLEYQENLDLCVCLGVVAGVTASLIGAVGWYRMVIVERGYLVIPDDWPE